MSFWGMPLFMTGIAGHAIPHGPHLLTLVSYNLLSLAIWSSMHGASAAAAMRGGQLGLHAAVGRHVSGHHGRDMLT